MTSNKEELLKNLDTMDYEVSFNEPDYDLYEKCSRNIRNFINEAFDLFDKYNIPYDGKSKLVKENEHMNKYQESLYRLGENDYFDEKGNCNCDLLVMDRILMQELVDRATPMKPFKESFADYLCPTCENYLNFDALNDKINDAPKCCSKCGQKIDWGDKNDN